MNEIKKLPFQDIIKFYDAIIFDIWGVIYDGIAPYEGAIEVINNILHSNKKVVFLSNNPRPYDFNLNNFKKWGIDISKVNIYTSGDAVREQLLSWNNPVLNKLGKKLYHLGAERNTDILSGLQVQVTENLEEANFILLTAYCDEGEDFNKYDALFQKALELKIPAICANPDFYAQQGMFLRKCAGAFGKKFEDMGGIVHYYGKPDVKVFKKVIDAYFQDIPKQKILMVGDTLETDILGANKVGIDSVLLLTGNGKNFTNENLIKPSWTSNGIFS